MPIDAMNSFEDVMDNNQDFLVEEDRGKSMDTSQKDIHNAQNPTADYTRSQLNFVDDSNIPGEETCAESDEFLHDQNFSGISNDSADQCPSKSSVGPCRSIEEASVSTTIEVTMEDAEGDRPFMINDGNEYEPVDSCQGESDEIMISADQTIKESTRTSPCPREVMIRLTTEEEHLFELLINAAEAHEKSQLTFDSIPPENSVSTRGGFTKQETAGGEDGSATWLTPPPKVDHIEIRVAGGWVRDKLLNGHSSDVDVALDCMMGVQFARIVQSYMAQQSKAIEPESLTHTSQNETKQTKQGKRHHNKQPKIGVIGANPSQSKHLETATMNIRGIDIDFVNLRAEEVYEANSRIPTSQTRHFGTPLEDALRRDFTINSLFYNIRTRLIEDWTGRGLDDLLVHRKIVTPVDANETFHDDPLRVLRAIRFCVRLDFELDDNLKEAAMSKRVHHSLHAKVSRERVGKELEGMLTGKGARPGYALDMIAQLHLAGCVFCFPGSFPGDHDFLAGGPVTGYILGVEYHSNLGTDGSESVELASHHRALGWNESSALLSVLPKVLDGHLRMRDSIHKDRGDLKEVGMHDLKLSSTVDERLLYLCVFILPFHNLTFPDRKGRESSVTAHMIKESLKFATRDIQAVSTILNSVDEMAELLSELRAQLDSSKTEEDKDSYPMYLTPPCRLRTGLLLRALKEHWVTCLIVSATWESRSVQRANVAVDPRVKLLQGIYAEQPSMIFYRSIVEDLALDECWRVRPHLNGKEIISELQLPKGPVVGVYIEDQVQWMLMNPNGTREECVIHLQERKRARELSSSESISDAEDDHKRQCVKASGPQ